MVRRTMVLAIAVAGLVAALLVSVGLLSGTPDPGGTVEPVEPSASYGVAPSRPPRPRPESEHRWGDGAEPLWRVVDETGTGTRGGSSDQFKPPYPASWSKAGRALVDVTAATFGADAWRVGDRLAVELPQLGGVHEWTVEQIVEGWDARSRSTRGWLDSGEGRPRRIVVTVGPGRVLAYVDTPRGPYELAGNAQLAWLVPSSSRTAGIDFTKSDHLLSEGPDEDLETP